MRDSLDILQTEDSIAHYGVMGMKWGVRKQRAAAAGMSVRDYKKQIKADNKEAFRLGKAATIADMTADITAKKLAKNKARSMGKTPTDRRVAKTARAAFANALAQEKAQKARAAMQAHRESLIKKYGEVNISQIRKTNAGRTNERVTTAKDWAINAGMSALGTLAGSTLLSPMGMRYFYVQVPGGKKAYAKAEYKRLKKEAKDVVKVTHS